MLNWVKEMTGVLRQFKLIDKVNGDPKIAQTGRPKLMRVRKQLKFLDQRCLGVQHRSNLSGKSDVGPKINQMVYKSDGGPNINWFIKKNSDHKIIIIRKFKVS